MYTVDNIDIDGEISHYYIVLIYNILLHVMRDPATYTSIFNCINYSGANVCIVLVISTTGSAFP